MSAEILHIRSKPHATESRSVEKAMRENKVRETAYVLHEDRHLKARYDPYEAEIIEKTSADELANRNWDLANSLVDSEAAMTALRQQHKELWERRTEQGQPVERELYIAPDNTNQSRTA